MAECLAWICDELQASPYADKCLIYRPLFADIWNLRKSLSKIHLDLSQNGDHGRLRGTGKSNPEECPSSSTYIPGW
jgi:hypothetical protein